MSDKWTTSQQKSIDSTSQQILVSASAGSGKTSTMIERILNKILNGQDIERLLVLTFSNASAGDMKEKLNAGLRRAVIGATGDEKQRLIEQLDKFPLSKITTIDAYCRNIVSEFYYLVEIDPSFDIISEQLLTQYKDRAIQDILNTYKDDTVFFDIVNALLTQRDETAIKKVVDKIYTFLQVLPSADEFINKAKQCFEEDYNQNQLVQLYVNYIVDIAKTKYDYWASVFLSDVNDIHSLVAPYFGNAKLSQYVVERLNVFKTIVDIPTCDGIKVAIPGDKLPTASCISNVDAEIKGMLTTSFNEDCKAMIELANTVNVDDFASLCRDCSKYVDKLFEVVLFYRDRLYHYKKNTNKYEFNDISHFCYDILTNNSDIAKVIADRFDECYVDEYQDTNRIQEAILSKISTNKRFMVGDIKQSIYGFRHTDSQIFEEKSKESLTQNIYFNENFRSAGSIIDIVNKVFSAIMTDYSTNPMICNAKFDNGKDTPVVQVTWYKSTDEIEEEEHAPLYSVKNAKYIDNQKAGDYELEQVASDISNLTLDSIFDKDADGHSRHIRYSDIAVLCRSNNVLSQMAKKLRNIGIPVEVGEKISKSAGQNILVDMLRVIDNRLQDIPLVAVMKSPLYNFTDSELYEIKRDNVGKYFYQSVIASDNAKVKNMLADIDKYRTIASCTTIYDLLLKICEDHSFFAGITALLGDKEKNNVISFINSTMGNPYERDLAKYISYYDSSDIVEDEGIVSSDNAVHLMTIHKSKGLQFPIVYLVATHTKFNDDDSKGDALLDKDMGVIIKSYDKENRNVKRHILYEAMANHIEQRTRKEEMRLLYVAMTRAEQRLYISGVISAQRGTLEPYSANSFADWIRYCGIGDEETIEYNHIVDRGVNVIGEGDDIIKAQLEEQFSYQYPYLTATTTAQKYTATSLNAMQEDEASIRTTNMKFVSGNSAEEGTIYHKVMQHISLLDKSVDDVRADIQSLVEIGVLTREESEQIDADKIYRTISLPTMREITGYDIAREKQFLMKMPARDVNASCDSDDEVLVQGAIDMLAVRGDEAIIIDYKYSKSDIDTLAKRYHGQLEVYKRAVECITGKRVTKCVIVSLDQVAEIIVNV